jgi:hypothetical protein
MALGIGLGLAIGGAKSAPPAATPEVSGALASFGTTTVPYSSGLTASGGTTPYTWSIHTGTLPAGLTLNTATGVISGTPTAAGTSSGIVIRVTGAASNFADSDPQSITVALFPVLSGTLASASNGVAYSQGFTLTGGHTPVTWSISSGTLPAGLTINSSTGVISGTPTGFGDSTFTVQVVDAHGNTTTRSQTVTSYGPELAPSATTPGSYTLTGTTPPTQDASGIHFVAASNIAAADKSGIAALEDNKTYEVVLTVANYVNGGAQVLVYGDTSAHLGLGTTRSAAGTFTERVTTSAAGSSFNDIRIRCTGATPNNNFDITFISVRKVS